MDNSTHLRYMKRCLELAKLGAKSVSPNPMVGAVIVYQNKIIGEGYHHQSGTPHAEVNAIASVTNKSLLSKSTIYVSLEPCAHYGKTPPCAHLIVQHHFKHVVIGTIDPHSKVHGEGIKIIENAGIPVTNLSLPEARELNPYFNSIHQNRRPFIILKWAQTTDGFVDRNRVNTLPPMAISNPTMSRWVHKLRSEVDGILIGKNTAIADVPSLNVRKWTGNSPIPIIIDPRLMVDTSTPLFSLHQKIIIINSLKTGVEKNIHYERMDPAHFRASLTTILLKHHLQSILVEGGAITTKAFITHQFWDVAITITSNHKIHTGVAAPQINSECIAAQHVIHNNIVTIYEKP